jgi:hypothetical protein
MAQLDVASYLMHPLPACLFERPQHSAAGNSWQTCGHPFYAPTRSITAAIP